VEDHGFDDIARDSGLIEDPMEADQSVLIGVASELEAGGPAPPAVVGRAPGGASPGHADREPAAEVPLVQVVDDLAEVVDGALGAERGAAGAALRPMGGEVLADDGQRLPRAVAPLP